MRKLKKRELQLKRGLGERPSARIIWVLTFFLCPLGVEATQEFDPAALHELENDQRDIVFLNKTVREVERMNVLRNGEIIGKVQEVLGNEAREVVAVVIDYGSNVLGLGEKKIIVPITGVQLVPAGGDMETRLTDEDLALLPEWNVDRRT
jgi:hypothetical protein